MTKLILKQKRRFFFDKTIRKGETNYGMKLYAYDPKAGNIYQVEMKYKGTLFSGMVAIGYTHKNHWLVWASNIRRANKYINEKLLKYVKQNGFIRNPDSPVK